MLVLSGTASPNIIMEKRVSISLETRLNLPREMATFKCGEEFVVVSPEDGNWLVVSDVQRQFLRQLGAGMTVGDVMALAQDKDACKTLLKQIFARQFTERGLIVSNCRKAFFYLTYDCNLRCEHCYMYAQKNRGDQLSPTEYSAIFEKLKRNGVAEVTFSGGEPLMRSDFWQIVKCARDVDLKPRVFSNGTLWTELDIERAKEYLIDVQISIDGVDEASNAIVRGANVFDRAKEVAVKLAKSGVDVVIATTPVLGNSDVIEHGYADFVHEMQRMSDGRIRFRVAQDLLPGRNTVEMTPKEKQEYVQRGIRLYEVANSGGAKIPFFDEFKKWRGREVCGLGRLVFSPDGYVYVCNRMDSFPAIGNIRSCPVEKLLKKAKDRIAAASVDNTIPCRDCALRHVCGGGCRAERFEKVSCSLEEPSVHNPCSERYKMLLLEIMVHTTRACYKWGREFYE